MRSVISPALASHCSFCSASHTLCIAVHGMRLGSSGLAGGIPCLSPSGTRASFCPLPSLIHSGQITPLLPKLVILLLIL